MIRKLLFLFRRRQLERDLEEEMRLHAEMTGRLRFGNLTRLKEESRAQWGFGLLESLVQDLRFAFRMLRKSPSFAAVAVLSLALGIGANAAIFSVIYAVVLRSLAVDRPEQLFAFSHSNSQRSGSTSFPYPLYRELRDRKDLFAGLVCVAGMSPSLSAGGSAERVTGEMVSANYFEALGLRPYAGRLFRPDDETVVGANPVAVLSYGFWRRRFGGDARVIGTAIDLNTTAMTIIGIAPPEFDSLRGGFSPDVRVPITMQPQMYLGQSMLASRGDWWLDVVGRLKPGISRERADGALTVLFRRYLEESFRGAKTSAFEWQMLQTGRVELMPAASGLESKAKRAAKQLYVLMAVVALVLASGCLNIANLLLARTAARQHEIAVRLSVGAGRRRIIRQLLTESVLLAAIGGILGIVVAFAGARLLVAFLLAGQRGISFDVTPGVPVLAFTFGLSFLTGILFGVAPAFRSTHVDLAPELKGERPLVPGTRLEWRKALISLQVALSLLLLIGAGLFVKSLVRLKTLDTGFDKKNVLEVSIDPTLNGYTQERAQAILSPVTGACVAFARCGVGVVQQPRAGERLALGERDNGGGLSTGGIRTRTGA